MAPTFQRLSALDRIFNGVIGALVRVGLGPGYSYLLEVRGRKSGKLYTAPVFVLDRDRKQFLVAPRGDTQWARNAEASGQVTLRRGAQVKDFGVKLVPEAERAPLLADYLGRHASSVQRFFSVQKGAPLEAFAAIASGHPVFELLPQGSP
jgi:deazaflavin-dependent oxidoreductase (nitroreductase family)